MPVAGSLAYAITLDASGFTKEIVKAGVALAGLKMAVGEIGKVMAEVWKPIEEGFRLRNMMKQTNIAISDLFKMEWALKAVGSDSSEAATMLTRFEKAIGGVNSEGKATNSTFAMMGLNIIQLRRMPLMQAFDLWLSRIKQLNTASAAFAATSIAGGLSSQTGAGGTFLRLARSVDDVREALRRATIQGRLFEQFGETFYQIIRRITLIKDTVKGFFAGLAAGAGPGLLYFLKQIDDFVWRNSQRIVEIGRNIGRIFSVFAEAFKEGKIGELIKSSLSAGLEYIGNFAMRIAAGVAAFTEVVMSDALEGASKHFSDKMLPKINFLGRIIDVGFQQAWEGRGKEAAEDLFLEQIFGSGKKRDTLSNAASAFTDAFRLMGALQPTEQTKAFKALIEALTKAADRLAATPQGPGAPGEGKMLGGIFHLPITALEKMGFTFRGGPLGIPGSDYAKLTADNTYRMVNLLSENNRLLGGSVGGAPLMGTRSFK